MYISHNSVNIGKQHLKVLFIHHISHIVIELNLWLSQQQAQLRLFFMYMQP